MNGERLIKNDAMLKLYCKDYGIDENTPFKWKKHLILPMFRIAKD